MKDQHAISFFPKLYRYDSEELSLKEVIILIRTRRWRKEITAYREQLAAGNKELAGSLKKALPGFTPSGVFSGGHKAAQLQAYNQVVGLDFDDVADLASFARQVMALPTTLGFFVSPGGSGMKVFVRVDSAVEQHQAAFLFVARRYEEATGLMSDRKCKDVSRCCYVSDDGEAYYDASANVFHIPPEEETKAPSSPVGRFVTAWLSRNPAVEGNRNQTVYRLGCEANRLGFSCQEISDCCVVLLQDDSFGAQEIKQTLGSAYQGNTKEHAAGDGQRGQLRTLAAPPSFSPFNPSQEELEEEGETLREQAPYLSAEELEGLPSLLRDAIAFYPSRREKDMALLAACTVLSACLPGVYGIYHRRQVFPHLFTVEVAPPANGKGCVTDMCRLADRYASLIEIETGRREKEYLRALEEWQLKKSEALRKHQPLPAGEAPEPCATSYFFIPAQVSKAKLLVHLRDNGDVGGLLADSEMDTLISAGRQDYGFFDDLIRKAFHHEPVASSRKTDNELIRIPRPRMAMLLAGTPGQFSRLVPDAENGLMSRLLLYTCRSEAVWQDVSPAADDKNFAQAIQTLSEQVLDRALALRRQPLQVCLTSSQWRELNIRFAALLREADLFGSEEFLSVVKRYALIAFRLCMLFTALDGALESNPLGTRYCTDAHFRAALSISLTCLEHSRLLMTQLKNDTQTPELTFPFKFRRLLELLPDHFILSEAYQAGAVLEMPERVVRRAIRKLSSLYISKISRGEYRKITPQAA